MIKHHFLISVTLPQPSPDLLESAMILTLRCANKYYFFQQILFYQNMLQSIQLLDSKRQIQVLNQKSDQNKKHKNISKFAEYLFINFDSFLWTCSCVLIVQKLLTNINHEMRTLCDAFTKFWKSPSFDYFSWNVNQNQ